MSDTHVETARIEAFFRALAVGRMTDSSFSPRLIGVSAIQRLSQLSLADSVLLSVTNFSLPETLRIQSPDILQVPGNSVSRTE